jgi:hypothetical protein
MGSYPKKINKTRRRKEETNNLKKIDKNKDTVNWIKYGIKSQEKEKYEIYVLGGVATTMVGTACKHACSRSEEQ